MGSQQERAAIERLRKEEFDKGMLAMAGAPTQPKPVVDERKAKLERDMAAMGPANPVKGPRLSPARFGKAEQVRGYTFVATLPPGTSYHDVLKPGYFSLIAPNVRIGTKIEIRDDSLSFYAELLVVGWDFATGHVEVRQLSYVELAPADAKSAATKGFTAKYEGVTDKWVVYRDVDGQRIKSGFETEGDAVYVIRTELTPRLMGAPM